MRGYRLLGSILFVTLTLAGSALADQLEARLVGNAAIEITDGQRTLLTDFPYASGAHGYLEYSEDELHPRPDSLCLITHSHTDHFAPGLVGSVGCRVVADSRVQERVPAEQRLPWNGKHYEARGLSIQAVPTDHIEGHNSYLVEWHGRRLYFTGDTESISELLAQPTIDTLFISPWLARKAGAEALSGVAHQVVIYHRAAGESPPAAAEWIAPDLGDTIHLLGPRPQGTDP